MFKPLICLVAGLALAGFSARTHWQQSALDSRAAVAKVEPLTEYRATTDRSSGALHFYSADLRFTAASGERVEANHVLSADEIKRAGRGDLDIHYLPEDPTVNRVGEGPKSTREELIIGVLLSLVGAFWLWRSLKSAD